MVQENFSVTIFVYLFLQSFFCLVSCQPIKYFSESQCYLTLIVSYEIWLQLSWKFQKVILKFPFIVFSFLLKSNLKLTTSIQLPLYLTQIVIWVSPALKLYISINVRHIHKEKKESKSHMCLILVNTCRFYVILNFKRVF